MSILKAAQSLGIEDGGILFAAPNSQQVTSIVLLTKTVHGLLCAVLPCLPLGVHEAAYRPLACSTADSVGTGPARAQQQPAASGRGSPKKGAPMGRVAGAVRGKLASWGRKKSGASHGNGCSDPDVSEAQMSSGQGQLSEACAASPGRDRPRAPAALSGLTHSAAVSVGQLFGMGARADAVVPFAGDAGSAVDEDSGGRRAKENQRPVRDSRPSGSGASRDDSTSDSLSPISRSLACSEGRAEPAAAQTTAVAPSVEEVAAPNIVVGPGPDPNVTAATSYPARTPVRWQSEATEASGQLSRVCALGAGRNTGHVPACASGGSSCNQSSPPKNSNGSQTSEPRSVSSSLRCRGRGSSARRKRESSGAQPGTDSGGSGRSARSLSVPESSSRSIEGPDSFLSLAVSADDEDLEVQCAVANGVRDLLIAGFLRAEQQRQWDRQVAHDRNVKNLILDRVPRWDTSALDGHWVLYPEICDAGPCHPAWYSFQIRGCCCQDHSGTLHQIVTEDDQLRCAGIELLPRISIGMLARRQEDGSVWLYSRATNGWWECEGCHPLNAGGGEGVASNTESQRPAAAASWSQKQPEPPWPRRLVAAGGWMYDHNWEVSVLRPELDFIRVGNRTIHIARGVLVLRQRDENDQIVWEVSYRNILDGLWEPEANPPVGSLRLECSALRIRGTDVLVNGIDVACLEVHDRQLVLDELVFQVAVNELSVQSGGPALTLNRRR
mmetsp:Transcript_13537/g.34041  ORF Transcript_13537/g.34041 Transcript_13537/m.34041 type:complete len:724 (+) Transcript_13537:201-2372(+)